MRAPNGQQTSREMGFEHHVAMNLSEVADPVYEALDKYLDWDVYLHES